MAHVFPNSVPRGLMLDAWWLTPPPAAGDAAPPPRISQTAILPPARSLTAALILLCLADWLLWGYRPGLSAVLFAFALTAAQAGLHPPRHIARAGAVLTLGALPMLEVAGPLSTLFLISGTVLACLSLRGVAWHHLPDALSQMTRNALIWCWNDARLLARAGRDRTHLPALIRNWGIPLGLTLIFGLFFLAANPVLERGANNAVDAVFSNSLDPWRIVFWGAILLAVWSVLNPRFTPFSQSSFTTRTISAPGWINASLIRNTLILLNGLFALQTGLDLTYLWGGAALPEGMSYASYAHRGAYPLLGTTVLSGLVMLVVTARGAISGPVRGLLYLWIAQNLLLVVSSMLRLDLYVAFYSLTYLRLAALIWMGLVAVIFGLIGWGLLRNHATRRVIARIVLAGTLTLYASSFINFPLVIARFNIAHSHEVSGKGQPLDIPYLCGLGPHAEPAVANYPDLFIPCFTGYPSRAGSWRSVSATPPADWREWGFRNWRLARYRDAQR